MSKEGFIHNDFLLENEPARYLYHEYASRQPIIDYHNHLSPELIARDHVFGHVSEVWLGGDHYKWRAMRAAGVPEKYITGNSDADSRFQHWADTVPLTIRNPLYHWTHLELKRYFGIDVLLNGSNANEIRAETNRQLAQPDNSTQGLLRQMSVEVLCTTDDPLDDLKWHKLVAENEIGITVLPTFRADALIGIDDSEFLTYISKLEELTHQISSIEDLTSAIHQRIDFFHDAGCSLSDHGLVSLPTVKPDIKKAEIAFKARLDGRALSRDEVESYRAAVLHILGKAYFDRGWVQQLHLGAIRNNNSRYRNMLGKDAGTDSVGDFSHAQGLACFLDSLDAADSLPKTILYNLNPADNEVFATMAGNFNDGSTRGKIQYGAAWWFLDQKNGMEEQLEVLSNMGLLSVFVGMLTDSRSFLSFPRHEYFRRILCNVIGRDITAGLIPNDLEWLGSVVSDICYHNAKSYFNFNTK